ncbi:hypothetical protein [Metabacillus endolithicus]|uniref:Uncharacterized protein n=1 Tax=Metabacillus endolithicus TaxID=1535204 RepID=A0ABW5BPM3_9BACI|nr:hypothetical protein [Metabacillus endolithicus]UPG63861.1 hypothetical protein MVE64_01475 [Metabacillus endolithicus]
MITVMNAESYLKNKIGEGTVNIKDVWEAFKAFSIELVEGEEEREILFQCGVYNFTGEKLFHFDFVRQFSVYLEGEYSHLEQLHCEFLFKPTKELKKLKVEEWSMDYVDIDEFFKHIESLKEFNAPLGLIPIKLEIYQEEN